LAGSTVAIVRPTWRDASRYLTLAAAPHSIAFAARDSTATGIQRAMFRSHRCTTWRARRLGAGLTLVAYVATIIGLPLTAPADKDRSRPFPCQNRPCGCRSAEECWRHCCCFSAEERLAWAAAHDVEPPEYAERPKASSEHSPSCQRCESHNESHAAHVTRSSSSHRPHHDAVTAKRNTRGSVVAWAALRCRGLSTLWVNSGAVLPPQHFSAGHPNPVPPDWIVDNRPVLSSRVLTPPDPPPRTLSV